MPNLRPVTPLSIIASNLKQVMKDVDIKKPLDPATFELLKTATNLAVELDPYLAKSTTPEDNSLRHLAEKTISHDWQFDKVSPSRTALEPEMLSGHVEGMFLKQIVSIAKCKSILEIGLFTGYSALAMAQALPEDGDLIACEIDPKAAEFAQDHFSNSEHGSKIDIRLGSALDTLKILLDENRVFDLVFIDADKIGYKNYFQYILDNNMIKIGGVFIIDNTLLQGEPYLEIRERGAGAEAIREFNDHLTKESRVEQVIIPLRDGVTLARRTA